MGCYPFRRLELEAIQPAWRRPKGIDNFSHKTDQNKEGLILDDPSMDRIDAADLKSWLTARRTKIVAADTLMSNWSATVCIRWPPVRSLRTTSRRTSITADEFFKITRKFFSSYKRADVLAILKRCVVGIHERPPTFEEDVEWEQGLEEGMQQMQLAGRPETYLRDINTTISQRVQQFTLRSTMRIIMPSAPSADEENRVPAPHPEALPVFCTNPPRRLGTFNIPGSKRRVTTKTSMPMDV
eukprot:s1124_g2.t1